VPLASVVYHFGILLYRDEDTLPYFTLPYFSWMNQCS
jgi:hypothetical protein